MVQPSSSRSNLRSLFSFNATLEEPPFSGSSSSQASATVGIPPTSSGDGDVCSFTSAPFRVYIEDTDAYGIIYHSNYLRAYERVLFLEAARSADNPANNDDGETTNVSRFVRNGEGWSIVAVGHQKFVSAPVLGEELVIHGQLVAASTRGGGSRHTCPSSVPTNGDCGANDNDVTAAAGGGWSVWNMQVTSLEGGRIYNLVTDLVLASPADLPTLLGGRVGTFATVQQYLPPDAVAPKSRSDPSRGDHDGDGLDGGRGNSPRKSTPPHGNAFPVYRDEVESHAFARLPLRTILNYFERGRTNAFGGPSNLRRLQQDDGIHAVVTSIRDFSLAWTHHAATDGQQERELIYPTARPVNGGEAIVVETTTAVKRKGMILEMNQSIKLGTGGGGQDHPSSTVIAQGSVYLVMVDTESRRPTSKLPTWVQSMLSMDEP